MDLHALFERQMAMYVTYHRDARNRMTHFIGIPPIVFSIVLMLGMLRFDIAGLELSAGIVTAAAVWVLWILLDAALGIAMGVFLVPAVWLAERLAVSDPGLAWAVAAACFVGGWAFQLLGHVFEGRRPALLSNLFQALIGPMFLVAEAFHALGLKRDLHRRVEALADERERASGT
ncbi:MAG TPA: Mpo1-like protein [Arenibaculum sp.]|nr:Mpo1-like protein [Arenibaculum sp.]